MRTVFADSFYFLSLINDRDEAHTKAIQFAESYAGRVVTTEWVLTEVGDALAQPHRRPAFLQVLQNVRTNPLITVVSADHALFEGGAVLFANRTDKEWSLTDCTSFVVMERQSLHEALTGDRHFEQAGFVALLK
jgi:predicted nucleic acid-binding protein